MNLQVAGKDWGKDWGKDQKDWAYQCPNELFQLICSISFPP